MNRLAGALVGMAVVVMLASGAHATAAAAAAAAGASPTSGPLVAGADPWNGQQPPPGPAAGAPSPGAYPGGYAPAPPPSAYPGGPGAVTPLVPYPGYYGNGVPQTMFLYEAQKKNELLALVIEIFIPGVGSIYADHVAGALLTWATFVGGVVLIFWWLGQNVNTNDPYAASSSVNDNGRRDVWAIYAAVGLIVGGRIYGLVDSYTSAKEYNRALRARLGLPEWTALGVVPIRTDRAVSWGPSLTFRF
jgi:hypothetical protein